MTPTGRWEPDKSRKASAAKPEPTVSALWLRSGRLFATAIALFLLCSTLFAAPIAILSANLSGVVLAPGLFLTLCLLPLAVGVRSSLVAWAISIALAAAMALTLVDAIYAAFYGRAINVVVDGQVLPRVLATLVNGFPMRAVIGIAIAIACMVAFILVARWTVQVFRSLYVASGTGTALAALLIAAGAGAAVSASQGGALCQTTAMQSMAAQLNGVLAYRAALPEISRRIASDPLHDGGGIAALGGANVHLIFIESYGSFILEGEGAEEMRGFLAGADTALAEAGYSMVSTTVAAPIIGGRSWLSHGTMLSGLTLENDAYTPVLYASDRRTLVDLFADAGYRTVAVGPSVRRPWSENGFFHFDSVLNFWDLDYIGPGIGPLEIPDQVTLRRIEELVVRDATEPLFMVTPLLSSHWPWTTVPKRLPWERLDRGQALTLMAEDTMEKERLAAMPAPDGLPPLYLPSLRYSLQSAVDYAVNALGDGDLVIILGDHPPAAYVTMDNAERGVPVHVMSRNPALLKRFQDAGYVEGLIPEINTSPPPMAGITRLLIK